MSIEFSDRYNAMYGAKDVAVLLLYMCKNSICAEQAVSNRYGDGVNGPGADWFLSKISGVEYDVMLKELTRMIRMIRSTVHEAKRNGMISKNPTVAIDKTILPRYGKKKPRDMTGLIKYKHPGTSTGEAYITAKIVGEGTTLNIALHPVGRDGFNPDFVRKILEEFKRCKIKPGLVLLDREFYAVDVMQILNVTGLTFLMPAVKNIGIKNAIDEYVQGQRGSVSKYVMKNTAGEKFGFELIIVPKDDVKEEDVTKESDRYLVFATNHLWRSDVDAVQMVPQMYRERWGIENGYKSAKTVRPRTTSTNRSVRIFMFFISLFIYNLWVFLRTSNGYIRLADLLMFMSIAVYRNGLFHGRPPDPPWEELI